MEKSLVLMCCMTLALPGGYGCGEQLDGLQGELTHPEYPEAYSSNLDCEWTTIALPKDTVELLFELLDVEADTNGACAYDYVSVRFPNDERPERFCGRPQSRDPNLTFRSNGTGDPSIRFISDDSMQFLGFKINYNIERYDYCLDEPCQNDGRCFTAQNSESGFVCGCLQGWTGQICDEDVDECESNPCENDGTCGTPEHNAYLCDCPEGFTGGNCETDIDECESEPCQNNGRCSDEINSYRCTCQEGYEGTHCETDINECASNPCQNGGSCLDRVNRYMCRCIPGYVGDRCETDKDECDSNPCENDGFCNDGIDRYECICAEGFYGNHCEIDINECSSEPCLNGGTCEDRTNRYDCVCVDGYGGVNCEIELDECDSAPCMNGAKCVDFLNEYQCICSEGYQGTKCDQGVLCHSEPCMNGGECSESTQEYECHCTEEYTGVNCEERLPCASDPCLNKGTCRVQGDIYKCDCTKKYTGKNCEKKVPEDEPDDESAPTGCQPFDCLNNGICEEHEDEISCSCKSGYTGERCANEIDECLSDPCVNGGSCVNRENHYWCVCKQGYNGVNCEDDSVAKWQRDSHLLSSLFPGILFVIVIAVLAVMFYAWMRRKRSTVNPVRNVAVKPAKPSGTLAHPDGGKKMKRKAPRKKIIKKIPQPTDYRGFSSAAYMPKNNAAMIPKVNAEVPYLQNMYRNPQHSSMPYATQQYSTVPRIGMNYPTYNRVPMMPRQQLYGSGTMCGSYNPDGTRMPINDIPNVHKSQAPDVYGTRKRHEPNLKHVPAQARKKSKATNHKKSKKQPTFILEEDKYEAKSTIKFTSTDRHYKIKHDSVNSDFNSVMTVADSSEEILDLDVDLTEHWQDRDNMRLNTDNPSSSTAYRNEPQPNRNDRVKLSNSRRKWQAS